MFIAMNRFRVIKTEAHAFEQVWLNRQSTLHELDGFIEFHMLKGPEREDHILYSSYTQWRDKDVFHRLDRLAAVSRLACAGRREQADDARAP